LYLSVIEDTFYIIRDECMPFPKHIPKFLLSNAWCLMTRQVYTYNCCYKTGFTSTLPVRTPGVPWPVCEHETK